MERVGVWRPEENTYILSFLALPQKKPVRRGGKQKIPIAIGTSAGKIQLPHLPSC